jgi:hypothetical protein
LTYTLIGPWCRLTSKIPLIMFSKQLFSKSNVMSRAFGELCPLYQIVYLETIMWAPNYVFPSLMNDTHTHIMGPMSEIARAFDHLLI